MHIRNSHLILFSIILIVSTQLPAQEVDFKTVLQTGHSSLAKNMRISPTGNYAATFATDNAVILWDLTLLKQIGTYHLTNTPKVIDFSPDERYIYVFTSMGGLFRWDTETGQSKTITPEAKGDVTHCMIWEDNKSFVTVHNDRFRVVELETGKILRSKIIDEEKGYSGNIEVSQKHGLLMLSFTTWSPTDNRLIIYDLATLELKKEIPIWSNAVAYSEKLNTVLLIDHDTREVVLISMDDYSQHRIETTAAMRLAVSPDQTKVLVSSNANMRQSTKGPNFWNLSDISLYDIESRTWIKSFPYQNKYHAFLQFITDDRLLMITENQGMHIINVDNDQFVKSFTAGILEVVDMGYDVEGDRLATHHKDTIYLWDRRMQRASTKLVNAKVGFREAHYGFFPTYRSSYVENRVETRKMISDEQDKMITQKLHGDGIWDPKESGLVNAHMMFMVMPSHDDQVVFLAGRRYKKKGLNIGLFQFNPANNQILEYDGHIKKVELAEQSHDHKHAYSASQGEIKTWEQSSQELLTTSYLFKEGGFVTITPDGYYTTSLNAVDQVVFAKGREAYTFENFDLNYNRPDIIAQRLGVASPEFVSVLKNAWVKRLKRYGLSEEDTKGEIDLPVLVMNTEKMPLETDQKVIEIPVSSTSKVPLNRYIVSVNGVPLNHNSDFAISGISDQRTLKVELTAGENRVKVICLNSSGFKSLSQSISINYTQQKIKPNLYLVSIGVSEFKQKDFNLTYADKDAEDVITLFENGNKYGKVISIPLLNKEANLKEFDKVEKQLQGARPEDHMIVFVASHGLLSEDLEYYLAMSDVDFESPNKGGLLYEKLEGLFQQCDARNRLVFLDACHSGEVDKDETTVVSASTKSHDNVNARGFKTVQSTSRKVNLQSSFDLMKELFVDLQQSTGATVISSASGEEYAFESPQWNNGVFTYALLRGLKTNAADKNKDGHIVVSEIQSYVYEQVKTLTNGKQNPTSRTENTENDFVVW